MAVTVLRPVKEVPTTLSITIINRDLSVRQKVLSNACLQRMPMMAKTTIKQVFMVYSISKVTIWILPVPN